MSTSWKNNNMRMFKLISNGKKSVLAIAYTRSYEKLFLKQTLGYFALNSSTTAIFSWPQKGQVKECQQRTRFADSKNKTYIVLYINKTYTQYSI